MAGFERPDMTTTGVLLLVLVLVVAAIFTFVALGRVIEALIKRRIL